MVVGMKLECLACILCCFAAAELLQRSDIPRITDAGVDTSSQALGHGCVDSIIRVIVDKHAKPIANILASLADTKSVLTSPHLNT